MHPNADLSISDPVTDPATAPALAGRAPDQAAALHHTASQLSTTAVVAAEPKLPPFLGE